jgi:TolB protein
MGQIIANDLARSGLFAPVERAKLPATPTSGAEVRFGIWKASGVENLVVGRLRSMGPDSYVAQFQVFDVYREQQIVGYSFPVRGAQLRQLAHEMADIIYEKITGQRGAFNTHVAYISTQLDAAKQKTYVLQVSDADGHDPETVLTSQRPLMSPAWSPDAQQVAYVSFENAKGSAVFVQDLRSGERKKVSALQGINGAPTFSPDGKRLALVLSHRGNPDIYVMDVASGRLTQLTNNRAIDTEPAWDPSGQKLLFTSDRSGSPQIYEVAVNGGRPERLSFQGKYNASPAVSPDGKLIAMVQGERGRYRIAVMDRATRSVRVLTDGTLDESPSFAPNGSMILYATEGRGRGVLGAVSVDGRMKQRFTLSEGDVREPVWSPFLN